MADFCSWVVACESALGWGEGRFMQAYTRSRHEAAVNMLAGDISIFVLENYLNKCGGEIEGTSSEICHILRTYARESLGVDPYKIPGRIGDKLRSYRKDLEEHKGIHIEKRKTSRGRTYRIWKERARPLSDCPLPSSDTIDINSCAKFLDESQFTN